MTSAMIEPTVSTMPSGRFIARNGASSSFAIDGSSRYPVSSVVSVMPSCALDRCVEVTFSAPMTGARPGFTAVATRFDVGAVEVDERELGRDEDAGAERQQDAADRA